MKYLYLLLLTTFLFNSANAKRGSFLFDTHNTSDGITYNEINLAYASGKNDISWQYKNYDKSFYTFGTDYTWGHKYGEEFKAIQLTSGYLFELQGKKSVEFYGTVDMIDNQSSFLGFKGIYKQYSKLIYLTLTLEKKSLYKELAVPGGTIDQNRAVGATLYTKLMLHNNIHVPFKVKYEEHSSDNSKKEFELKLLYGKSYPVWVWVGPKLYILKNSNENARHWTPNKYTSYGIYAEAAIPYKSFNFLGSLEFNKGEENDLPSSSGKSGSLGIKYGSREKNQYFIQIARLESTQESSEWNETNVKFGIDLSFN